MNQLKNICVLLLLFVLVLVSCEQEPQKFKVSFVLEGQPYSYEEVISGQKVSPPVPPGHKGYSVAWYKDTELSEEYDFSTPVTSSFTLYGKWILTRVPVPENLNLTYNGAEQDGVLGNPGYTLKGTTRAENAGYYTATASLNEGYCWTDGSQDDKVVHWTIARRPIQVVGESAVISYDGEIHNLTGFSVEGLLSGHLLTGVSYLATGKNFGKYNGVFSGEAVIKKGKNDITRNYDIFEREGTLKIIEAGEENRWTTDPSITGWTYGQGEAQPQGESLYGDIEFTYSMTEDFKESTAEPVIAGQWYMKARVEATAAYGSLERTIGFTIEQAPLKITGIKARDKQYDGLTEASLDFSGITVQGLIEGDDLEYSAKGTFNSSAPGSRTVTISDLAVSGIRAGSYILTDCQTSTTADILKKELTIVNISAENRQYDGTTAVVLTGGTLYGVVEGEEVDLDSSKAAASVKTADAGKDKAVTVTGFAITGKDKAKYSLLQPQGLTIDIAKAPSVITQAPQGLTIDQDGQSHAMVTPGTYSGGIMNYSTDGSTWSENVPSTSTTGKYTVRYKVAGDSNHEDTSVGMTTCTINPLVIFVANGHGTAPDAMNTPYGVKITMPADPEASGYAFGGWFKDSACKTAYDTDSLVTTDLTLYAKWSVNQCQVSFDSEGGSEVTTVLYITYGDPYGELPDTHRDGYVFDGWSDGTRIITPATIMEATGNQTLHATWSAMYTISEGVITEVTEKGVAAITAATTLDIPVQIDDVTITGFTADELAGNTSIKGISMACVYNVGNSSFTGCTEITSITACPAAVRSTLIQLGSSNKVKSIVFLYREGDATQKWTMNDEGVNCAPALTDAVVSSGITSIPTSAFQRCISLENIVLPSSLLSLGERCFQETAITEMTIPSGVTSIAGYAFYNCSNLETVVLPESVESLGTYSFWFCPNLETVAGGSVTTISSYAFQQCRSLENIDLSKAEYIGSSAFGGCQSLMEIHMPSIKSIGISSFAGCTSLETVSIGSGSHQLDSYSFSNCEMLAAVEISGTVTDMGYGVFSGCPGTAVITFNDMTGPGSWPAGWSGDCIVHYKED